MNGASAASPSGMATGHVVRSPIAVRAKLIESLRRRSRTRCRRLSVYRRGLRIQRALHAGRARIVGTVPGLLSEHSGRSGQYVRLRSAATARWSHSASRCQPARPMRSGHCSTRTSMAPTTSTCTCSTARRIRRRLASWWTSSFTFTSEERVSVDLPEVDDPSTDADDATSCSCMRSRPKAALRLRSSRSIGRRTSTRAT